MPAVRCRQRRIFKRINTREKPENGFSLILSPQFVGSAGGAAIKFSERRKKGFHLSPFI